MPNQNPEQYLTLQAKIDKAVDQEMADRLTDVILGLVERVVALGGSDRLYDQLTRKAGHYPHDPTSPQN